MVLPDSMNIAPPPLIRRTTVIPRRRAWPASTSLRSDWKLPMTWEPGHRGADPFERVAVSGEEAVADLDADQAASCHLDVRGYELAAGRLVLTVHALSALALPPVRQSARRWRARSAPATSPARPQRSPR
jgi:hypothetical protein